MDRASGDAITVYNESVRGDAPPGVVAGASESETSSGWREKSGTRHTEISGVEVSFGGAFFSESGDKLGALVASSSDSSDEVPDNWHYTLEVLCDAGAQPHYVAVRGAFWYIPALGADEKRLDVAWLHACGRYEGGAPPRIDLFLNVAVYGNVVENGVVVADEWRYPDGNYTLVPFMRDAVFTFSLNARYFCFFNFFNIEIFYMDFSNNLNLSKHLF